MSSPGEAQPFAALERAAALVAGVSRVRVVPTGGPLPQGPHLLDLPLLAPGGARLGSLWLVDHRPVEPTPAQREILEALAQEAAAHLSARQAARETGQAWTESELRSQLLEDAQHLAGTGSWWYEPAIDTGFWSRELYRIFECDPAAVPPTAEAFFAMTHPEDRERAAGVVTRAMATGEPYEVEHRVVLTSGEERTVLGRGAVEMGADGVPVRVTGSIQDVTDARRAERELDAHAQMLRAVIENNQSLIFVKDLQGRYLLLNQAFAVAQGLTEEQMLGSSDFDFFPAEMAQAFHDSMLKALDGPRFVAEEADLPDGTHHFFDSAKIPLYDAGGEVYAICGISLDVTERRRAERDGAAALEAIGEARDAAMAANAAKSAFLATMSHEIRTPMNAVLGLTGLLLGTPLDAGQRDLLETVRSSGDLLLAIINDILDFSKIESGQLDLAEGYFDLTELVEASVAGFAPTAGEITLTGRVRPGGPERVVGDATRLRQVLTNLVGNALKFTTAGSVVLEVTPGAGGLRFEVTDTGIGIPADRMHRLFKPFSQVDPSATRAYGGTGLGLAICRALVEAMGGELTVSSTPGVGSVFGFTLALAAEPEPVPAPPVGVAGGVAGGAAGPLRILLAEDNAVNQKVAGMILARLGHSVRIAPNGAEAVAAARAEDFDVVLMDIHMPVMDGLEATRRIRADVEPHRQPRIVALTASVTLEDRDACAAAGMNGFLPKPVRPTDLAAVLDGVARRNQPA